MRSKKESKEWVNRLDKYELGVISILRELGIPAHIRGYRFIIAATKYLRKNPSSIYHITKELYPEAGKSCDEKKPVALREAFATL